MQKGSRTKVESDSDSDTDYLDYLKQTQARSRRKKNAKKAKNINDLENEEIDNYFSTSEDEVIDIKNEYEVIDIETEDKENSENKNIEDTFNEQSSEINKKQQIKTMENLENDNNSEFEENRPPPVPPPPNSKSTRQILTNKNIVECRDQLTMRKHNYVYFVTTNGIPRDNGSKSPENVEPYQNLKTYRREQQKK